MKAGGRRSGWWIGRWGGGSLGAGLGETGSLTFGVTEIVVGVERDAVPTSFQESTILEAMVVVVAIPTEGTFKAAE
jgi:hypothetical protein